MTPSEAEHRVQKHLRNRNIFLFKACCEEELAREVYIESAIAYNIDDAKESMSLAKKTIEKAYLSSKGN